MTRPSDKLSAVVVAAGQSSRFRKSLEGAPEASSLLSGTGSKQFIDLKGKPLIHRTLESLYHLPIAELALVIRPEDRPHFENLLRLHFSASAIVLVEGGRRRQDSVRAGLQALSKADRVLVHDGARPFLSAEFLKRLDDLSREHEALIPVMPIVETLKEIDATGVVVKTHPRSRFVRVQTPQFFRFAELLDAYRRIEDADVEFTDDASLMEYFGKPVHTCEGSAENIKVTEIQDVRI